MLFRERCYSSPEPSLTANARQPSAFRNATHAFIDNDGRPIMLSWVCGFKPGRGLNGCLSLPRILALDKDQKLVQMKPIREDAIS